jgi:hypothetical protein
MPKFIQIRGLDSRIRSLGPVAESGPRDRSAKTPAVVSPIAGRGPSGHCPNPSGQSSQASSSQASSSQASSRQASSRQASSRQGKPGRGKPGQAKPAWSGGDRWLDWGLIIGLNADFLRGTMQELKPWERREKRIKNCLPLEKVCFEGS